MGEATEANILYALFVGVYMKINLRFHQFPWAPVRGIFNDVLNFVNGNQGKDEAKKGWYGYSSGKQA